MTLTDACRSFKIRCRTGSGQQAGKTGILCSQWFEKQQWRYANGKGGALAVTDKLSGELYGWCGLLVQEVDGIAELEVGYSVLVEHWGHGYASEAAGACVHAAFERDLANSLISIIQVDNTPSRRVAKKIGMTVDRRAIYRGVSVLIYRKARGASGSSSVIDSTFHVAYRSTICSLL